MPNRLANEDSPYLQQHKENTIDWYPWCDEAFKRARTEQRPIFISVGYSTCHWCHAMERDVFANEEIASVLNEHFICIKVDREERPDIDKYYQKVHFLLNRKPSGWPTSVFCTPENRPVFAGTYITPNSRGEKIGFLDLSRLLASKVAQHDERLYESAEKIQAFLDKPAALSVEVKQLNATIIQRFINQAVRIFEPKTGGFSNDLKFPQIYTLNALLDCVLLQNNTDAEMMLSKTLSHMHRGGMYDLVDGGFCRYSTDVQWLVPRFEKMTFDNGLHCELYARAGRMLHDESYLQTAKEVADFMLLKMQKDGLFFSASDAESEGKQGLYFTFEHNEVATALREHGFNEEEVKSTLATLHITVDGNFYGRNIIWLESPSERPVWFNTVKEILSSLRSTRTYPFIDKKVQTSWNAMMIRGLFELGKTEHYYTQKALESLQAVINFLMPQGELYHVALLHGSAKIGAFLEDYAYLGTACIKAYEVTLDTQWLTQAQALADSALQSFFDNGRWNISGGDFPKEEEPEDGLYPSSIGVMVDLLLSLGILQNSRYRELAFTTLQYYSVKLAKAPISVPHLFNQLVRYLFEDMVVKSNAEKLDMAIPVLNHVKYPYVHVKVTHDKNYMLCGTNSCFAQLKTPMEIADTIREKFSD